jgi:hypothetical protein
MFRVEVRHHCHGIKLEVNNKIWIQLNLRVL